MRRAITLIIFITCMIAGLFASAQEPSPIADTGGNTSVHVLGGHILLGGAGIIEDSDSEEMRARFAGGFGFNYKFYLKSNMALAAGLDFVGKGGRNKEGDVTQKTYLRCMEFPLGVVFEPIPNLQIGGALVISIALTGKEKEKEGDDSQVHDFNDDDWDNIRRFNLGPRLSAGYAIPVGPVKIVPGLMWELDLINAYKGDGDAAMRAVNLMLTAGVQYGL